MSKWIKNKGGLSHPNLGQDWGLVSRSYVQSRTDRPNITVPSLIIQEISKTRFMKQWGYEMRPFGVIDFETWRDFTDPCICSFLFYRTIQHNKQYHRSGMKAVEVDGVIRRSINGFPLDWVDDTDKWGRDENDQPVKPKTYGAYVTRGKKSEKMIQVISGWCWSDEVVDVLPNLIEESGIKIIYAHNATVDIIACMSLLFPDLHHPLQHFTSPDEKEKSPILFKGSKILNCDIDIAPFLGDDYKRVVWNYKHKKVETISTYEIELRDSLSLLPLPLSALGWVAGYEKTKTPELFTNERHKDFKNYMAIDNEMIRYAVDDCVILWKSLLKFWCLVKGMGYHGTTAPLTIGTLGFQMIAHDNASKGRHIVKKSRSWKYKAVHNRVDLDIIARECLTGGMTRVFKDHPIVTPSFGIDERAAYQSIMIDPNNTWPDFTKLESIIWDDNPNLESVLKYEGAVHVHWLRPDSDKIGAVATRDPKTNNLDWNKYEGTRWVTMCQARFLIDRGYTLTPIPYAYEKTRTKINDEEERVTWNEVITIYAIVCPALDFNPFEVVGEWYDKRIELKNNDDPRELLVKLLMNAGSFGKWVEINFDQRLASEMEWEDHYSDEWEFKGVQEIDGEMIGYVKNPIPKRASNTANLMGAYICDYARMALLRMGDLIGYEHLIYCDTDSWKIALPIEGCYIPDHLMGRELGQWAIENEMDYFHAIKPKQYKTHFISKEDRTTGDLIKCDIWKIRIKGVNVKGVIKHLWLEKYDTGEPTPEFSHEVLSQLCLADKMRFERLVGIRESFRRNLEAGKWMIQDKQNR